MSGFEPLFGGGRPREEGDRRDDGFEPLFGRKGAGAGPVGFTPLHESLGQPGPARAPTPEPTGPVDLDALLAEAHEAGAAEARAELEGRIAELEAALATVGPALDQVAGLRRSAVRQAASDVGALVLAVTRRIVGDSLALHPEALPRVLEEAVATLDDDDELRIRVARDDVERAREVLGEARAEQVTGDPSIDGGCRVEARHAAIDATVEAAVDAVETAVRTWVESRG